MTFHIQVILNGLTLAGILVLMGSGLSLIFGILRIVNFSHGVLFTLGAYVVYFLATVQGLPYVVSVLCGGLVLGLLSLLLEISLFRRFQGLMLEGAVMSVGVALFLESAYWILFSGPPRRVVSPLEGVIDFHGIIFDRHRLMVLSVAALITLALHFFVRLTRYGRATRAVQQDPFAAALQGINPNHVSALTFFLGGGLAGLAGGLMAPMQLIMPNMGTSFLLLAFVVIIVGGLGSISGVALAAILVGITQSYFATFLSPTIASAAAFSVAMITLIVRPKGLFGHE